MSKDVRMVMPVGGGVQIIQMIQFVFGYNKGTSCIKVNISNKGLDGGGNFQASQTTEYGKDAINRKDYVAQMKNLQDVLAEIGLVVEIQDKGITEN